MNESTSQAPRPSLQPHEDFFAAQRRNRRATWRISILCAVAIAASGIPLTLIVTPLLYAAFMAAAAVANYFWPLSPAFWQHTNDLTRLAKTAGDFLFNHRPADAKLLAAAVVAFLGPGIFLATVVWAGVYALLRRGGVGGTLMMLGARAPNRTDAHELQLDHVVHEMALAARMQPLPRLLIIDADGANAAAIGTSTADAHLVISRGLIECLRREEMQGAIAHLIASIGSGDLRIAFRITSVFETLGMLVTMLNAPFGPHARATIGKIVRFAFERAHANDGAEAEAIATMLAAGMTQDTNDIDRFFDGTHRRGIVRKALNLILFPIFLTNAAIQLTLWFLSQAMLAPAFAMLWRARKYLADATSVQLLRNPDALASALVTLNETSSDVATVSPYLFIVSPGHIRRFAQQPLADQMDIAARAWASINDAGRAEGADFAHIKSEVSAMRIAAMHGDRDAIARLAMFARAMAAARTAVAVTPEENASGPLAESMLSFHPSIARRLMRLVRMGARADFLAKPRSRKVEIVLAILLGPLIVLLVVLFVLLIAMMIMLNLIFLGLWFAAIHLFVTLVMRM